MRYLLNDGHSIIADSNEEFIRTLNKESKFGYFDDLNWFMKETAKRCLIQNSTKVRTENYDIFVEDLVAGGFVLSIE